MEESAEFTDLFVLEAFTEDSSDNSGEVFVREDLSGVDHAEEEPVLIDVVEVDPLADPGLILVGEISSNVIAHGLRDLTELLGDVVRHEFGEEVDGFGGDFSDGDGLEVLSLFLDVDEALDVFGDFAELGAGEGDEVVLDVFGDFLRGRRGRDILTFLVVGEGITEDEVLFALFVPLLLGVALGVEDDLLGVVNLLEFIGGESLEEGSTSVGGSGVSGHYLSICLTF